MADQEFQINIKTLADLTGIKLTQQQLDALQTAAKQGNVQAINAMKQLADAQKQAQANMNVGLTGSTVGLGTLIYMLNFAVHKWAQFSAEQDRWVDSMIKAQAKMRDLGEDILDIQDKESSLRREATEPLQFSYERLTHQLGVLRVERSLLNLPAQGDEFKELTKKINETEAAVRRVTSAMQQQKAEADKAAEKKAKDEESFMKNAVQSSSAQTKAVLMNEDAARRAREAGDEKSASQYEKTAEQLKKSMTEAQRQEYEGLTRTPPIGRKAGPYESQDIIDQQELNKVNFERQQQGMKPLSKQEYATEKGTFPIVLAIENLKRDLLNIWR